MPESLIENSDITDSNCIEQSKIRVLIVEDDEYLLKVLKSFLEIKEFFEIELVDSVKEGEIRLQKYSFDVIVSDYEMLKKNHLHFLEEIRKKSKKIPLILFTDSHEITIKALNLGVYRFIDKHNNPEIVFSELSLSIKQAAQKSKFKLILKDNEERFQQVAENSQVWIWEVDSNGLYTFSNPAVEKILGYKPEEIIGKKHFYDFFLPEEKEKSKQTALSIFHQKQSFRDFINRNIHKSGNIVWLST